MLRALSKFSGLALVMAGLLFIGNVTPVSAQATGDGCGTAASLTDAQKRQVQNKATAMSTTPEAYACRNVASISSSDRTRACVTGLCPDFGSSVLCCPGTLGAAPGTDTSGQPTSAGTVGQTGGVGRLALPACVATGSCGLDDIVTMGVNFSNFLFGISGAIFLLIFVVAGFRYIFFAWDAGAVKEAKSSLVKASIGMAIIALAGILTTFVYNNLRGGTNSGTESRGNTCEEEVPGQATGYMCQTVTGVPSKDNYPEYEAALNSLGCRPSSRSTNLCPGDTSYCCPPGVSNVYPAQQ